MVDLWKQVESNLDNVLSDQEEIILSTKNASFFYHDKTAVRDVSLNIKKNKITPSLDLPGVAKVHCYGHLTE